MYLKKSYPHGHKQICYWFVNNVLPLVPWVGEVMCRSYGKDSKRLEIKARSINSLKLFSRLWKSIWFCREGSVPRNDEQARDHLSSKHLPVQLESHGAIYMAQTLPVSQLLSGQHAGKCPADRKGFGWRWRQRPSVSAAMNRLVFALVLFLMRRLD